MARGMLMGAAESFSSERVTQRRERPKNRLWVLDADRQRGRWALTRHAVCTTTTTCGDDQQQQEVKQDKATPTNTNRHRALEEMQSCRSKANG